MLMLAWKNRKEISIFLFQEGEKLELLAKTFTLEHFFYLLPVLIVDQSIFISCIFISKICLLERNSKKRKYGNIENSSCNRFIRRTKVAIKWYNIYQLIQDSAKSYQILRYGNVREEIEKWSAIKIERWSRSFDKEIYFQRNQFFIIFL